MATISTEFFMKNIKEKIKYYEASLFNVMPLRASIQDSSYIRKQTGFQLSRE
jgi:hypothetical protein